MRLLYWDEQSGGHHRRYAAALAEAAPAHWSIDWPSWFDDETAVPPDPNASLARLIATTARHRYDALVIGEATRLLREIALSSRVLPPVLALDLRSPQAWLQPSNRRVAGPRDLMAGLGQLASMEVLVRRRQRVRILHLNPQAARVGTRTLRAVSGTYRDPLEILPHRTPRPEPGRVLLPGVQAPRKGLPLLVSAIRNMRGESGAVHLVIAGPVARDYEATVDDAAASLRASGIRVTVRGGWLSREEMAEELARAQVIAIPYLRHIGGSGFIGTGIRCSRATIVCPDIGLLGDMAQHLGLKAFTHGDAHSLSQVLNDAISGRAPQVPEEHLQEYYSTDQEFGRTVWVECQRLIGGAST